MDLSYIRELYEKGLFAIHEGFEHWEDSIYAAVQPMVDKGLVLPDYAHSIIEHVGKYGNYIFMAPHICMPHCKAYQFVKSPGVAFMKSNRPVIVDKNEPEMGAELFFAVAAQSEGEHIEEIQKVAELLMSEEIVNALVAARTEHDFRVLFGIVDD